MTDPADLGPLAERMVRETPQAAALGIELVEVGRGAGTLRLPYRADLVGDPATGVLAGGVITTLLDHVCGLAVASLGREGSTATLDLRIDYMRAAEPGLDVTARAACDKVTRSVAFVRGVAFDRDESDPVATVQAAFVLNRSATP